MESAEPGPVRFVGEPFRLHEDFEAWKHVGGARHVLLQTSARCRAGATGSSRVRAAAVGRRRALLLCLPTAGRYVRRPRRSSVAHRRRGAEAVTPLLLA